MILYIIYILMYTQVFEVIIYFVYIYFQFLAMK